MKRRLNEKLFSGIYVFFLLVSTVILGLIVFAQPMLEYSYKKNFDYSNISLFIMGMLGIIVLVFLRVYIKVVGKGYIEDNSTWMILLASLLLFVVQVFVSYHIYFKTGWDAGDVILPTAQRLADGSSELNNKYFSRYPNNILLAYLFGSIIKISRWLSIVDPSQGLFPIIIFQCMLSVISGILIFLCVKRLVRSIVCAWLGWILYCLLLGTSPWIVIPYSDSVALFMPVLIFYMYLRYKESPHKIKYIVGIVSFSILGYKIKPQVVIVLIAICMVEIIRRLRNPAQLMQVNIKILASTWCSIVVVLLVCNGIETSAGFQLNEEDQFGLSHFAMMGLNHNRNGVYWGEDVKYSASFNTKKERTNANLKEIKTRIGEFGITGLLEHLAKKTLVNFSDGTFAWECEGGFYNEIYEDKDPVISPWLRSWFYSSGSNYHYLATCRQFTWLLVLGLQVFGFCRIRSREVNQEELLVLLLSILGLIAFLSIFEARARYVYLYIPFYIITTVIGMKNIISWVNRGKRLAILS